MLSSVWLIYVLVYIILYGKTTRFFIIKISTTHPKLSHTAKISNTFDRLILVWTSITADKNWSLTVILLNFVWANRVLSYKFSFVCGQDLLLLYLIRIYENKFDKHARKCVFLINLYHILACASKSCKQNARCIGPFILVFSRLYS
jgi:hypothetical protein